MDLKIISMALKYDYLNTGMQDILEVRLYRRPKNVTEIRIFKK